MPTQCLSVRCLLVGATFLGGCLGEVGGVTGTTERGGAPGTSGGPVPGSAVGGFELPKTQIKVLAFSVRLDRIAAATGLPLTDPAYATLRENRLLLGDHDYANAKPPQESWSPARLVTWVESVRPVCQAPAVRAKLSPMPGKLSAFIEAAYGRALLPEDTAAFNESARGLAVPPEKVVEGVCVSVLSSLEFVAQ